MDGNYDDRIEKATVAGNRFFLFASGERQGQKKYHYYGFYDRIKEIISFFHGTIIIYLKGRVNGNVNESGTRSHF